MSPAKNGRGTLHVFFGGREMGAGPPQEFSLILGRPGAGISAGSGVTRVAGSGRHERDEGLGRATKSVDRLPPQLLLIEKVGLDDGVPVSPMKDRRG